MQCIVSDASDQHGKYANETNLMENGIEQIYWASRIDYIWFFRFWWSANKKNSRKNPPDQRTTHKITKRHNGGEQNHQMRWARTEKPTQSHSIAVSHTFHSPSLHSFRRFARPFMRPGKNSVAALGFFVRTRKNDKFRFFRAHFRHISDRSAKWTANILLNFISVEYRMHLTKPHQLKVPKWKRTH